MLSMDQLMVLGQSQEYQDDIIRAVDQWMAGLSQGLTRDIIPKPRPDLLLSTGNEWRPFMIMEGASTLSGGQRLMIARAIVNRPAILIFDEATSALDNRNQAVVSESLSRLKSTRIIVAHRLSTIKDADKIYVMDKGEIRESGTFDSLGPGRVVQKTCRTSVAVAAILNRGKIISNILDLSDFQKINFIIYKIYWGHFQADTISGGWKISKKAFNHTIIVGLGNTHFSCGYRAKL